MTGDQIRQLAGDWEARSLWRQVEWAADDWWASQNGEEDQSRAWVRLLLAVGNFKRQAPIRDLPEPPVAVWAQRTRPSAIALPVTASSLGCADEQSWRHLTELHGLGVPTSTTLLSALWPGCHVVIDLLSRQAAVGLALDEPQGWFAEPSGTGALPSISWAHYVWYRNVVVRTAQVSHTSAAAVERALFVLAKHGRRRRKAPARTWLEYRAALERQLSS